MNRTTYDIFDNHQHVGGVLGIPGAGTVGVATTEQRTVDRDIRLRVMDRFGIRQTMLMPGHSYPMPNGIADTRAVNDGLAAYRRLDPERFVAIIGTVEPRYGLDGLAEIDRMHFELGFRGVSWHPRQQGLGFDHPVMQAYFGRMSELGLIPFTHCYVDADFEAPWRLRHMAETFPETTFVCMDSMTHPELFEEALAIGERVPNIVFDTTSTVLGPHGIKQFVDRLGPTRLLFGTNLYSMAQPSHLHEIEAVIAADIPDAAKHLIFGGNARRLLGL